MCGRKDGCRSKGEAAESPGKCSDEQVRACHGDAGGHPCVSEGCEHPERLRGKPGDCSPEQVRTCHGDAAERTDAGSE